jgi:hypothetical protein
MSEETPSRPSPCPVCESGGTTAWHEEGWHRIQAYCSECGLAGPYAKTTDEAAELWQCLSFEQFTEEQKANIARAMEIAEDMRNPKR